MTTNASAPGRGRSKDRRPESPQPTATRPSTEALPAPADPAGREVFRRELRSGAVVAAAVAYWRGEVFVDVRRVGPDGRERALRLWWPDVCAIHDAVLAALNAEGEELEGAAADA